MRALNEPGDYGRALALPAPEIKVLRAGAVAPGPGDVAATLSAWSVGEAASALGLALDGGLVATVNGARVRRDPEVPLAAGDVVRFAPDEEARRS